MTRLRGLIAVMLLALAFSAAPAHADCDLPSISETRPPGTIVFNANHNVMQYCDGTVWKAMIYKTVEGGGADCPASPAINGTNPAGNYYNDVWKQGNYIYTAENDAGSQGLISAFTFDGTSWTHLDAESLGSTQGAYSVWGDGTYIYVAQEGSGVRALSFNGTAFTLIATYDTTGNAYDVWGDGTYIYVADGASGVHALTFNGTAWSFIATYNSPANASGVWGDGTYIYLADDDTTRALTFNGTAWSFISAYDNPNGAAALWGDGSYIYVSEAFAGIRALSFDGASWASLALEDRITAYGGDIHTHGGYIYIDGMAAVALTFDGSAFSVKGYYPAYPDSSGVFSDGTYLYVTGGFGGINAYTACTGGGDSTPDAFTPTDGTDVALSTLTTSDIVQITGISGSVATSISGGGSPQYRICADATCSSEVQTWTSSANTIENNQYLQLRLTSSASNSTMLSATMTVGTGSDQWDVTTVAGSYAANAVTFDGTADYLELNGGPTTFVSSKQLTASFWFRRNGGNGANQVFVRGSGNDFRIRFETSNLISITGDNAGGTTVLSLLTAAAITDTNWHHALVSVDLATAAAHLYIDDASALAGGPTLTNDFVDYPGTLTIGAVAGPSDPFNGDMADVWVDTGTYIDFSVAANRREFISAAGKPVDLGADGSAPTGSAPDIFFSGATAGWHTNKGTGTGFTEFGALTDAATSPSD